MERAAGEKCERCWKYTTDVGSRRPLPHHLRALRRRRGRDLAWLIARLKAYAAAAAVFALDRLTKWLVEMRVSFATTYRVIPGLIRASYTRKTAAWPSAC